MASVCSSIFSLCAAVVGPLWAAFIREEVENCTPCVVNCFSSDAISKLMKARRWHRGHLESRSAALFWLSVTTTFSTSGGHVIRHVPNIWHHRFSLVTLGTENYLPSFKWCALLIDATWGKNNHLLYLAKNYWELANPAFDIQDLKNDLMIGPNLPEFLGLVQMRLVLVRFRITPVQKILLK